MTDVGPGGGIIFPLLVRSPSPSDTQSLGPRSPVRTLSAGLTDEMLLRDAESVRSTYDCNSFSLTVLGASGDLAFKKTFPAIFQLWLINLLPKNTVVMGYARSSKTDVAFREHLLKALKGKATDKKVEEFLEHVFYTTGTYDSNESFSALNDRLELLESCALVGDGDGDGDEDVWLKVLYHMMM
jgi:hypothetical protein